MGQAGWTKDPVVETSNIGMVDGVTESGSDQAIVGREGKGQGKKVKGMKGGHAVDLAIDDRRPPPRVIQTNGNGQRMIDDGVVKVFIGVFLPDRFSDLTGTADPFKGIKGLYPTMIGTETKCFPLEKVGQTERFPVIIAPCCPKDDKGGIDFFRFVRECLLPVRKKESEEKEESRKDQEDFSTLNEKGPVTIPVGGPASSHAIGE